MSDAAPVDLHLRTRQFASRIIKLYCALPKTDVARVLGIQCLRSGTSVGAHYREGHRARSTAEFISKIETALQELDETGYWMELMTDNGIVSHKRLAALRNEVEELISILVTSVKTAKRGRDREKPGD